MIFNGPFVVLIHRHPSHSLVTNLGVLVKIPESYLVNSHQFNDQPMLLILSLSFSLIRDITEDMFDWLTRLIRREVNINRWLWRWRGWWRGIRTVIVIIFG